MNRPAASTPELMEVPTTVTVTPFSAAPLDADVNALAPPCTVPVIVAAVADDPGEVEGEVGVLPWPPHPLENAARHIRKPIHFGML
jgi:hypothetical protein